jgi:hypothetical protein
MKAMHKPAALPVPSKKHRTGLENSQQQKMSKMQVAPRI